MVRLTFVWQESAGIKFKKRERERVQEAGHQEGIGNKIFGRLALLPILKKKVERTADSDIAYTDIVSLRLDRSHSVWSPGCRRLRLSQFENKSQICQQAAAATCLDWLDQVRARSSSDRKPGIIYAEALSLQWLSDHQRGTQPCCWHLKQPETWDPFDLSR